MSPCRRFRLGALLFGALSAMAGPAVAMDLIDAWQAARQHDLDYAAARSGQAAGATHRDQASALWRPTVVVSGTTGVARGDTAVSGARFSAPGFGSSTGVAFDTSVNRGLLGRWAVQASLPLYNRERDAQGRQLGLSADLADLEWEEARQALMLVTVERYLDVVLAQESVRVLRRQRLAVGQASAETQDRFRLGDVPVTDTHEAAARFEAIDAEVLALETDLRLKQAILSDATGLQPAAMALLLPGDEILPEARPLDDWLADAVAGNLQLRMRRVAVEVERQESQKSSGAFSPNVDLVAQVGRERLGGRGEFGSASSGSGNGFVGVQIVVPLYTGGMRDARHQEAQHAIDKAQAQVERTRQTVAQQVRAAWLGLTVGSARIRALSQALASNRSRLEATRLGRKVGDRTTLDLLSAENDAAGAELALLSARAQSLMNRLRLAAASGRLDEATLASANASLQAPASH